MVRPLGGRPNGGNAKLRLPLAGANFLIARASPSGTLPSIMRVRTKGSETQSGFTRTDLCAVLFALSLLAALALPALAKMKPHSDRASCANNLRELGIGWHCWARENKNELPWHLNPVDGGTRAMNAAFVLKTFLHTDVNLSVQTVATGIHRSADHGGEGGVD